MGISVSEDGIFYNGNPATLKKEITERFLSRENQSAASIAEENGVTVKTLYNWADKYAKNHPMKKRNPSSIQKMKFLITFDYPLGGPYYIHAKTEQKKLDPAAAEFVMAQ